MSSAARPFHQASVSFAIVSIGRNVSPALTARALLQVWKPFESPAYGAQIGKSTPSTALSSSSEAQCRLAGFAAAFWQASSTLPHDMRFSGPQALKTPFVPFSPQSSMKAERSRTSITWIGSSLPPGTSTSPPWSTRTGQ